MNVAILSVSHMTRVCLQFCPIIELLSTSLRTHLVSTFYSTDCRWFRVNRFHLSKQNNCVMITLFHFSLFSDDESDKGQAFYVGGSETGGGGQQVLGPPRRDGNKRTHDPSQTPDVFIRNLFQAARGKGAEVLDTHQYNEYKSKSKKQSPFSGIGYK